jgi:two-component system cell cycle sensor histidine kinase/response regulator CckA
MFQDTLPDTVSDFVFPHRERTKTVMLVEDDPMVRLILCRLLREYGFFILEAANGPEAVFLAEVFFYPIHLVITDLSTPKMTGYELAERMASLHPETQVLLLGEQGGMMPGWQALLSNITFLQKPCRPDALMEKVCEVLYRESETKAKCLGA